MLAQIFTWPALALLYVQPRKYCVKPIEACITLPAPLGALPLAVHTVRQYAYRCIHKHKLGAKGRLNTHQVYRIWGKTDSNR